jgi:hypothetical protein
MVRISFITGLLCFLFSLSATAQWSGTSWNSGSPGGTAHVSGVDALYANPSRIMINRYKNGNEILLGSFLGLQTDRSLSLSTDTFKQISAPFNDSNSSAKPLPYSIDDQYISRSVFSSVPFGFVVQNKHWSLALSVQQHNERVLTYSDISESLDNNTIPSSLSADFSEISYNRFTLGFAQPISYLNGLKSDLGHWFMGTSISYVQINAFNQISLQQQLKSQSDVIDLTGTYSSATQTPSPAQQSLSDRIGNNVGYGVLMDYGISFVQPLGDDISLIQSDSTALERSFSLSVGIRNLGFTQLDKNSFQQREFQSDTVSVTGNDLSSAELYTSPDFSTSDRTYQQLLNSLGDTTSYQSQANISNASLPDYIIPWQFTIGAAFDYNWFAIYSDVLINLNELNSFALNNVRVEGGLEFSLIPLFDLRSGVSLKGDDFSFYSLGATLNLGHLLIESAIQYSISGQDGINPQSVAITGLKIRF